MLALLEADGWTGRGVPGQLRGCGHRVARYGQDYSWSPPQPAPGALRVAAEHRFDVVILDPGLPDIAGIEVLAGLRGLVNDPSAHGARNFGALVAREKDCTRKTFDVTGWLTDGLDGFLVGDVRVLLSERGCDRVVFI